MSSPAPPLSRRFASLFYDALLLLAVLFLAGFVVVGLLPRVEAGVPRVLYQVYLLGVAGAYLTWFWSRGGQTLAMKTWRIRLIDADGGRLRPAKAWLRFGLATLGLLTLGLGFLWALWDRDGQYLHDHLLGSRLVRDDPSV